MLEPYTREKEQEIQKLWEKEKISEKVRAQSAKQKKPYYFMDGPPYATGHIHMGTALNKILKDVAMRSHRMQGFNVFDRPGYDTHGVPIENKVEQKLGFKGKQDIETHGVEKFISECRDFATQFIDVMNSEFIDLGIWMDWKNPYLTLSDDYIEAIWFAFKKANEKGLLYLGKYPVHVCPHCATAVAFNEIEYVKQTDTSVYVKFPVKGKENTFLVIWTTTPWSLPGNTGVMVHPKFDYVEAKMSNGEKWIVAKELLQGLMDSVEAAYTIEKEFKGKELEGTKYTNPLAKHLKLPKLEKAFRVILSERYVDLETGTGLVHTAPGHGKEDFDAGRKAGLPVISPVGIDGLMTEMAGKYERKKARVVDKEIISDLEEMNALVLKHPYTHDYPTCWRCKSPLLMLSVKQWFLKISAIQKKLLKSNKETKWVPDFMQDRMHDWLQQLGDWPVSRARYWGTPLPIWVCEDCEEIKVVGSVDELKKESGLEKIEVHKPKIDEVELKCKCNGKMKRVSEVLDVWFDSGVSSWAALGYPANKELFEKFWPASLNLEGTDQFRGWWNSQLILSTIAFDKKPFETIMVHGLVTDMSKVKMSKSRGNAVSPKEVIEKHNRDYLRFYLAKQSRGQDIAFDWESFRDVGRFFNVLFNSFNYASLYLDTELLDDTAIDVKTLEVEDKWILSRLNSTIDDAMNAFNGYKYFKALQAIEDFVMVDLSRTYIKLVRAREDKAVSRTMSVCMDVLLRLLAPITPHISEYLYQNLKHSAKGEAPESIHLLGMPTADKEMIDKNLEEEMGKAQELIQAVLSLREQEKLRRRWPLEEVVVVSKTGKEFGNTLSIIATSCNVKKAVEKKEEPKGSYAKTEVAEVSAFLNTATSDELKDEWELQELRRKVQDMRKQAKLMPQDTVSLLISGDEKFLEKFRKEIEEDTNTKMKIGKGKGEAEKLIEREFLIELKK